MNFNFLAKIIHLLKKNKIITILFVLMFILTSIGLQGYNANKLIYIIFSILSFIMLSIGLTQNYSFGVKFFCFFIWLGFWLKSIIHLILKYDFFEPIGKFMYTINEWDQLYTIICYGLVAIIFPIVFFMFIDFNKKNNIYIYQYIHPFMKIILWIFALSGFLISLYINEVFNVLKLGANLGVADILWLVRIVTIFMIGVVVPTILLFLMSNEVKNFNSFLIHYLVFVSIAFSVGISIQSRSVLIMWVSPIFFTIVINHLFTYKQKFILLVSFVLLVILCVKTVNHLRYNSNVVLDNGESFRNTLLNKNESLGILRLAVDRWIGIEGLMAVSSYDKRSFDSFWQLSTEFRDKQKLDFFSKNIALTNVKIDILKDAELASYASLPGPFAFFYLSGNYLIFIVGLVSLVCFLIFIEIILQTVTRNIFIVNFTMFNFAFYFSSLGVDFLRGLRYIFAVVLFLIVISIILKNFQIQKTKD